MLGCPSETSTASQSLWEAGDDPAAGLEECGQSAVRLAVQPPLLLQGTSLRGTRIWTVFARWTRLNGRRVQSERPGNPDWQPWPMERPGMAPGC